MSWWSRASGGSHTMLCLARMGWQQPEGLGHAALPHIQLAETLQDERHLGERLGVLVVPCSAVARCGVPAQHRCSHLRLPRAQTAPPLHPRGPQPHNHVLAIHKPCL